VNADNIVVTLLLFPPFVILDTSDAFDASDIREEERKKERERRRGE